ncbi:GNAT family N-acetyltransferase [Phytoactinopolyspora halotolerans]|uniref:GNAT family N-acetyltransferase n=1 Tax=Phytoactinopolyspora halotolerans TaxID=1981512 RepID=A0A6L9SD25_9ACTN|nr:GNAT family N-acetyltransferase [Phytoactinopolyspora halotolerans]NEE01940.1 GNAT family N-acetyltransferase [Phytoactinopolyspora halotolerans]
MIRRARGDELEILQEVERAAGAPFREVGMDLIADDDPPSISELAEFQRAGRAWVHVDDRDRPVAYLLADVVDGCAHIEQVSVRPDHARQGRGRELIDAVDDWARGRGLRGLTLTTYADVPWNAPYYQRLGFRILADDELAEGLRTIRKDEAVRGLDMWPRVAMFRELP